jgi:hypothetical protein
MKKGFSILLVLVLILSGVHVTISTHFCGGKPAASEVSFSGKLATCGMEGNETTCPLQGQNIKSHCCEDVISLCGIDNNYTYSSAFEPVNFQTEFQSSAIPILYLKNQYTGLIQKNISYNPPGVLLSTDVDISRICIFLI